MGSPITKVKNRIIRSVVIVVDCHGFSIDHTGLPSLVSNHERTMPTTRHFCAIDVPRDDTPFPQETGVVFVPDLPGDDASETTRGVDSP